MDQAAPAARPGWPFWTVAVLGLAWNCLGAAFYVMARMDPAAVMGNAPPEMRDYVANMPLWANIGYGFGVWGSFVGSVLMVMRSRHAVTAFVVSLVGAAVSFAGQAAAGVLRPGEPIVILAVIAFLLWFSRRAAAKGDLR